MNSSSKQSTSRFMRNRKKYIIKKLELFFLLMIIFFLLAVLSISIYKILIWNMDNKKTKEIIEEINEITIIDEIEDNDNTELVNEPIIKESDYWYYIKTPLLSVDFNNLISKNEDTVGWVNVSGTNINYPFVQVDNNKYYLDHSYNKIKNSAGWVFLDYRNNKDLTDNNNILYAHGRYDKTMFGSLTNALEDSWFKNLDNHIIRISTPSENTLWQIFSVYKIEEETYYITTKFSSDKKFEKFIKTMTERSVHNFNTSIDTNDKLLTLSTCYNDNGIRMVVHAKLIKREKR